MILQLYKRTEICSVYEKKAPTTQYQECTFWNNAWDCSKVETLATSLKDMVNMTDQDSA